MILPIFLLDDDLKVEAIISNELRGSIPVIDDGYDVDLDDYLEEIELVVPGNHKKSVLIQEDKYILYPYNNIEYKLFKIVEMQEAREAIYTKTIYAEISAQSELIEELLRPVNMVGATLETIMNKYLELTDWELGDYEDFGPITIVESDYPTVLEALRNLFKHIGAEVSFTYDVEGTTIKAKKINVYKKLGNELGRVVFNGKDLESVVRTTDTRNLVTAMIGIGPDQDGIPMNFADYTPQGLEKGFSKPTKADWVGNDEALSLYSRNGKHRLGKFIDTEADSKEALFLSTQEALKKYMKPQVKYEAQMVYLDNKLGGGNSLEIGSKLLISDNIVNPPITLEARIRHLHSSLYNPVSNSVELGDYIPIEPTQDETIKDIQDMINKNEQDWNASKWKLQVVSSAGTVFKNGQGETTLTAMVYKGPNEYDHTGNILTYEWFQYDKNGQLVVALDGEGRAITGKSIRVTPQDIDEKGEFECRVTIDNP